MSNPTNTNKEIFLINETEWINLQITLILNAFYCGDPVGRESDMLDMFFIKKCFLFTKMLDLTVDVILSSNF